MLVEAERSLKRNKDEDGNATWPEVVQKYARCMYFCITSAGARAMHGFGAEVWYTIVS